VRPDACPFNARKRRGSRASSVGAAGGGREIVRRVWEKRVRGRVRGERDRRGWTVRGFMARATKRRGVSRSFPRRAGEASRCAPQRLAPWKRSIWRYPKGLCEGCFDTCAGRENEEAQKSNQQPLGSPESNLTLRRLPNVPLVISVAQPIGSEDVCEGAATCT
jgi:hypothetical protein